MLDVLCFPFYILLWPLSCGGVDDCYAEILIVGPFNWGFDFWFNTDRSCTFCYCLFCTVVWMIVLVVVVFNWCSVFWFNTDRSCKNIDNRLSFDLYELVVMNVQ